MSAYRDALALNEGDSQSRLELAVSKLSEDGFVVLFEQQVALRRDGRRILCEVIDPYASGADSADRFQDLIASAQTMFNASALSRALPGVTRDWIVVSDYGTGTVQRWPKRSSAK